MYGTRENGHAGSTMVGTRFGTEISAVDGKLLLGPKLGYEICVVFLSLRGSLLAYIQQNKQADWRLLPEIGLSGAGFCNLMYGMAIPITGKTIIPPEHRITLTFNI